MYLHTLLLLFVFGAIAAFAAVNWGIFTRPTTLSLVFATAEAPLGLIMLALAALLTVLFLMFLVYLETSVIIETRRHARELRTHRELAERAETSRLTDLRSYLEAELPKLAGQTANSWTDMQTRLSQLNKDLRSAIEQAGNTLSAYIGELEDRLEGGRKSDPDV